MYPLEVETKEENSFYNTKMKQEGTKGETHNAESLASQAELGTEA
jgi:hypothetical protein